MPSAPLHPNCYLSPTQFAEKFGLPKPETARKIPEIREKEEGKKEDTGGGDETVTTETTAEPEVVPAAPEQSEIPDHKPEIKPGVRPAVVLLLLALSVVFSAFITLTATGHVNVAVIGEQIRRLFRL